MLFLTVANMLAEMESTAQFIPLSLSLVLVRRQIEVRETESR